MEKAIIKNSILGLSFGKLALYSFEYLTLLKTSQLFSFFVQPPHEEKNKELVLHLQKKVIELLKLEADYFSNKTLPLQLIERPKVINHAKNYFNIYIDALKVSRRRKLNKIKDFPHNKIKDYPDYFKRNYHFQTGGYFTEESAKIYGHQVEILFSGTAATMRRLLIAKIKEHSSKRENLEILELAAGSGCATKEFIPSFKNSNFTITDISSEYIEYTKKSYPEFFAHNFLPMPAEKLDFNQNSFDLIYKIYLFHEIPAQARVEVLKESFRVLKPGGILAIADSIQIDDDPKLNEVLKQFPRDYHEPFYRDYIEWNLTENAHEVGFKILNSSHHLLTKYWILQKPE